MTAGKDLSGCRIIVIGASGLLGTNLCRYLGQTGIRTAGTCHSHRILDPETEALELDLKDLGAVERFTRTQRADAAIYAAGLTSVDACEEHPELAFALNAQAAAAAAAGAAAAGSKFVYISTDHLWDGTRAMVEETTPPAPVNAYARSKVEGERMVAATDNTALIVRTNFFGDGPPWRPSLSDWMVGNLRKGVAIDGFTDSYFTPIHISRLTDFLVDLIALGVEGPINVAGSERISKYGFAMKLCAAMGLPADLVRPASIDDAAFIHARRPKDMSLSTRKVSTLLSLAMPSVDDSIGSLNMKSKTGDIAPK